MVEEISERQQSSKKYRNKHSKMDGSVEYNPLADNNVSSERYSDWLTGTVDVKVVDENVTVDADVVLKLVGMEGRAPGPTGHALFSGISLELRKGESLVIMGPSGCGKSSLLRVIAGELCAYVVILTCS